MFVVKLVPQQIPAFWDTIKYICKETDTASQKNFPVYCNKLLHDLLNEKAQCWVRLDDNRVLLGMMVTEICHNKQTDETYLHVPALYSWKMVSTEMWLKDWEFFKEFAVKAGCKYIDCQSANPQAWRLFESVGLREVSRSFAFRLD